MPNDDLISRKTLLETLEHFQRNSPQPIVKAFFTSVLCVIENADAVEAEPVRHAKWVYDDLGKTYCSACKGRIPFITEWDVDDDCGGAYDVEIDETNYCHNCGAKMDKEE